MLIQLLVQSALILTRQINILALLLTIVLFPGALRAADAAFAGWVFSLTSPPLPPLSFTLNTHTYT